MLLHAKFKQHFIIFHGSFFLHNSRIVIFKSLKLISGQSNRWFVLMPDYIKPGLFGSVDIIILNVSQLNQMDSCLAAVKFCAMKRNSLSLFLNLPVCRSSCQEKESGLNSSCILRDHKCHQKAVRHKKIYRPVSALNCCTIQPFF